jgi:hypothetical protein
MKFICLELAHTISRELPEFHLNFGTISNIEALSVLPMPKNGASPNKRKYIFFRECKRKYMISDEYHNLYTSPFLFSSFIFHSSTNSWHNYSLSVTLLVNKLYCCKNDISIGVGVRSWLNNSIFVFQSNLNRFSKDRNILVTLLVLLSESQWFRFWFSQDQTSWLRLSTQNLDFV